MRSFEKLIQEINPKENYKIDDETEKLIIYRPRTGQHFYEINLFDKMFNTSDRHFVVNHKQLVKIEGLECAVIDGNGKGEIKLKVTCLVGAIKAKAHKLVKLVNKSEDLEETIRKLFVNWTHAYMDVSQDNIEQNFTDIDGKLRKHYEDCASARGIHLAIIRIDLGADIEEFLDGFSFATDEDDDPNYSEDIYHTKEADVDVRLRINVSGKGETLDGNLTKYNRKGKTLIKEIKLQTIEFVRQWMRKISPEEIYMSDRDKKLDELGQDLTVFYRNEFNVFNPIFSLTALDTEPKLRLESLMSQEGKIRVEDATNKIKYDMIYSVIGVSDWAKFILRQKRYYGLLHEEYATLTELMENEIERGINRAYGAKMEWLKSEKFDDFMRKLYQKAANDVVSLQYGLVLGAPILKRYTTSEEINPEHEWMKKYDIQKAKRKKLLELLEEYELSDDMEEEIEEIEVELKQVSEKMKTFRKELPKATPTDKTLTNNDTTHDKLIN
ncbi:MAG: hypothetical protein ACI8ZM_000481 [Crocinitomix sp.]|jgi:hypothetical protein